jgi:hypothetical protein
MRRPLLNLALYFLIETSEIFEISEVSVQLIQASNFKYQSWRGERGSATSTLRASPLSRASSMCSTWITVTGEC